MATKTLRRRLAQIKRVVQVITCLCLLGMAISIEWSYSHSQTLVIVNYLANHQIIQPHALSVLFAFGCLLMLARPDLYFWATLPILIYAGAAIGWGVESQVYQGAVMYSFAYSMSLIINYILTVWEEIAGDGQ